MADGNAKGAEAGPLTAGLQDILAKLGGQALGSRLGGGGSTASSSSSAASVSVNPNITVIGGSGSANPSSGGYATASPAANATANTQPPWSNTYGMGANYPILQEPGAGAYGPAVNSSLIPGIPDWLLLVGVGVAAWAFVAFGDGKKGGR